MWRRLTQFRQIQNKVLGNACVRATVLPIRVDKNRVIEKRKKLSLWWWSAPQVCLCVFQDGWFCKPQTKLTATFVLFQEVFFYTFHTRVPIWFRNCLENLSDYLKVKVHSLWFGYLFIEEHLQHMQPGHNCSASLHSSFCFSIQALPCVPFYLNTLMKRSSYG